MAANDRYLEKLALYWAYPFVRYALIVGVLIALCSSLLGVTLVLKRFSFIGDGLSHVAFGAMAIAAVLQPTNEMPLVMAVTVLSAVLLLRTGQNTKIKGDAVIAMISVGSLAVGYLLMNIFSTSSNLSGDVCSTLFGSTSILTLSLTEVWLCAGMSISVAAVFILFYNKIFAVTFDENFARATGTKAGLYNLLIAGDEKPSKCRGSSPLISSTDETGQNVLRLHDRRRHRLLRTGAGVCPRQESPSIPDEYPELGAEITVVGTFEWYEEDGCRYYRLGNASFVN